VVTNGNAELEAAFDAAIARTEECLGMEMSTLTGTSARPFLEELAEELRRERDRAVDEGTFDHERFRHTIRSLVDWLPETEMMLIAALGRIVRATPTPRG
jgi:hypothetical protein